MLTIKTLRHTETYIYQSTEVTVLDKNRGGDELKAHVADCNIKAANLDVKEKNPPRHDDMKAVICHDGGTSYLFPGDKCYITTDSGKTIHSLEY